MNVHRKLKRTIGYLTQSPDNMNYQRTIANLQRGVIAAGLERSTIFKSLWAREKMSTHSDLVKNFDSQIADSEKNRDYEHKRDEDDTSAYHA